MTRIKSDPSQLELIYMISSNEIARLRGGNTAAPTCNRDNSLRLAHRADQAVTQHAPTSARLTDGSAGAVRAANFFPAGK